MLYFLNMLLNPFFVFLHNVEESLVNPKNISIQKGYVLTDCLQKLSKNKELRQKRVQNKTNSENRHLVILIFKKKQQNDSSVILKDEISPTPSFSCFFLNIRNTRCLFYKWEELTSLPSDATSVVVLQRIVTFFL